MFSVSDVSIAVSSAPAEHRHKIPDEVWMDALRGRTMRMHALCGHIAWTQCIQHHCGAFAPRTPVARRAAGQRAAPLVQAFPHAWLAAGDAWLAAALGAPRVRTPHPALGAAAGRAGSVPVTLAGAGMTTHEEPGARLLAGHVSGLAGVGCQVGGGPLQPGAADGEGHPPEPGSPA